jgi:glycerol-3-phosphate cytidylyltransferase
MSTVYVGGTFDMFHIGHVELLRGAWHVALRGQSFSARVVVALNTDDFIEQYKGRKPVCSYEERKAVVEAIKYVDRVIPNIGGTDSKPSILQVNPDYICVGSDWTADTIKAQMSLTDDWLMEHLIQLHIIPRTTGVSSSGIKDRL